MDGHGIGYKRLGLPATAPVLGFAQRRAPGTSVAGFDGVKFNVGDLQIGIAVIFNVKTTKNIAGYSLSGNGRNDK